jgi:hypothetical protein
MFRVLARVRVRFRARSMTWASARTMANVSVRVESCIRSRARPELRVRLL